MVSVRVAGCALDSGSECAGWRSSRGLDLRDLDIREPSRPVSLCNVRMTGESFSSAYIMSTPETLLSSARSDRHCNTYRKRPQDTSLL